VVKLNFSSTYTTLPNEFFSYQAPTKVRDPQLFCFNEELASLLDMDSEMFSRDELARFFSGNDLFDGTTPISLAYAGHQFGYFTMLGDGRAVLLGEIENHKGERYDIQLKASGQTPYSRSGDGRGTLSSMLREYMISEALNALGIKTTRSLAVVTTGQKVYRDEVHQGAVLTRVARTHIRVGTFEYAKNFCSKDSLEKLLDYTIHREYPDIKNSQNPALTFLEEVMKGQIDLIVEWMRVGFIHGVMNTDNMSVSCESIDFGPCAFMNSYNPDTVFSSIDREGRYRYINQPKIAKWNLSVLADALLPLIDSDKDRARETAGVVIDSFDGLFRDRYNKMMCKKIGLDSATKEGVLLVSELLFIMEQGKLDYTNTFARLSFNENKQFLSMDVRLKDWYAKWRETIENEYEAKDIMRANNPIVIPRNHLVDEVLELCRSGRSEKFFDLLRELKNPYVYDTQEERIEIVPPLFDEGFKTFCGT